MLETLLVDAEADFGSHQAGQVEREAEGVVQLEGVRAGDGGASGGFHACDHLVEDFGAASEGDEEALLFGADDLFDRRPLLFQLREYVTHRARQHLDHFVHDRLVAAERARIAHRAAQDAAQHVTASLVARHRAVGEREGERAAVVGNHAHGDVGRAIE